jgi:hypothetical protein
MSAISTEESGASRMLDTPPTIRGATVKGRRSASAGPSGGTSLRAGPSPLVVAVEYDDDLEHSWEPLDPRGLPAVHAGDRDRRAGALSDDEEWERLLEERVLQLVYAIVARQRALDLARRQRLLAELDDLVDELGEEE